MPMSEAAAMLQQFQGRLIELHVSEVNARSKHDPLTLEAVIAFRRVSHLIPPEIPIILKARWMNRILSKKLTVWCRPLDRDGVLATVIITPVVDAGHETTEADLSRVRLSVGLPGAETALGRFSAEQL